MRKHRKLLSSFTKSAHRISSARAELSHHQSGRRAMTTCATLVRDVRELITGHVPAHANEREVRFVAANFVLVALASTLGVVAAVILLAGSLSLGMQTTASKTPISTIRPATNPVPLGLTASLASYKLITTRESANAEAGATQGAMSPVDVSGLTPATTSTSRHLASTETPAKRLSEYFTALRWEHYTALGEIYQMELLAQAASAAAAANTVAAPTGPIAGGVWAALRECESGDNYSENTGNGYYGAYQFSLTTWEGLGYSGLPSNAPPPVQDAAAQRLQAMSGWGQWPACAAKLGLI